MVSKQQKLLPRVLKLSNMEDLSRIIVDEGIEGIGRYYSCYKGYVVNNEDPRGMNRLKVCVPAVNGVMLWALPKGQHGALNSGFKFLAPQIGDVVWVTFEAGDLSKPIWEYYGWAEGEIPLPLDNKNVLGIVTPNGNILTLNEEDNHLDIYVKGDIAVYTPGTLDLASDSLVRINSGNNDGVVKIQELTDKLNNLIKELEELRSKFNTHTHSGVSSGGSMSGPSILTQDKTFSPFNKSDYEDTKFTH
jgi:hypothetical protein